MNQLVLNWPSSLQTAEEQQQAIQKAFSDIQKTTNANATSPLVVVYLPTTTKTVVQSTNSASYIALPGWSWTINSSGGLVAIDAVVAGIAPANAGSVAMLIDGKIVLEQTSPAAQGPFSFPFHWGAVLGSGKHTISFKYKAAGAGNISINNTGFGPLSSTIGILEFPSNVQDANVAAA